MSTLPRRLDRNDEPNPGIHGGRVVVSYPIDGCTAGFGRARRWQRATRHVGRRSRLVAPWIHEMVRLTAGRPGFAAAMARFSVETW
jgi:hypothetical protein